MVIIVSPRVRVKAASFVKFCQLSAAAVPASAGSSPFGLAQSNYQSSGSGTQHQSGDTYDRLQFQRHLHAQRQRRRGAVPAAAARTRATASPPRRRAPAAAIRRLHAAAQCLRCGHRRDRHRPAARSTTATPTRAAEGDRGGAGADPPWANATWSLTGDHGSGGGSGTYSNSLSLSGRRMDAQQRLPRVFRQHVAGSRLQLQRQQPLGVDHRRRRPDNQPAVQRLGSVP